MKDILDFSVRRWGADRGDRYLVAIRSVIAAIVEQPDRGHIIEDSAPGFLFARAGRHFIVYRVTSTTIHVARVLHDRMDPRRHLP